MKIGILSRNSSLYSTRRLLQAARLRGHEAFVIDTTAVSIDLGHATSSLQNRYPKIDAIIPRIGTSITEYGLAVVRQFEALGIPTTASSAAIEQSRNKLQSLQLMQRHELPIPKTAVVNHPGTLYKAIQAVGGLPVVMKQIYGTQGDGVVLVHDIRSALSALPTLQRGGQPVLVQEFIAEAQGQDLRIIVINGRCIAAMQRSAPPDDFRANLHQGGTAVSIALSSPIKKLAQKASHVHGLQVAGVDLLQSTRGPLLLEINSSPGLQGIETVTGVNVSSEIVAFVETAVGKRSKRTAKKR
ncbi:MAG: RimK family alpha-L-glutamate ligase [Anaerolineales bacterium]|nr:RimK family alpha-L-glutamate ligase [Anaerolineales bacterium]